MTPGAGSVIFLLLLTVPVSFGQQQAAPLLSPDQLDNLVAPVALYPDPLLSQALAASTYPLEIVEAQQWLQQNSNLQRGQLIDRARQQSWDPSVQALVAFPEALRLLSSDIRWTTDLGNAFLAQQADVMSAVQRMRARARANGRLTTTPQQVVTTDSQDGQSAIEIQPADPQVIYVPVYQPAYVWGPPAWDLYPDLWYGGFGFGFGPSVYIGGFFPGWYGWGGWGWGCGWFGHNVFVNAGFFNRYGFRGGGFGGRGFAGRGAWAHDPGHRLGVPYANPSVAGRFNRGGTTGGQFRGATGAGAGQLSGGRFNGGQRGAAQWNRGSASGAAIGSRSSAGGWRSFNGDNRTSAGQLNGGRFNGSASAGATGSRSASPGGWRSFSGDNRTAARNYQGSSRQVSPNYGRGGSQGFQGAAQGYRGYGSTPGYRGAPSYSRSVAPAYSAPRQSYSAPRSFSAPHYSGGQAGGGGRYAGGGGRRR